MAEYRSIEAAVGVVKWFDPRKGFGFIVGPDGQDIFAHYTAIQGAGFRVLHDGSEVVYDAELTDKGWKASRVVASESSRESAEETDDEPDPAGHEPPLGTGTGTGAETGAGTEAESDHADGLARVRTRSPRRDGVRA